MQYPATPMASPFPSDLLLGKSWVWQDSDHSLPDQTINARQAQMVSGNFRASLLVVLPGSALRSCVRSSQRSWEVEKVDTPGLGKVNYLPKISQPTNEGVGSAPCFWTWLFLSQTELCSLWRVV
jgi:hypothetical protein